MIGTNIQDIICPPKEHSIEIINKIKVIKPYIQRIGTSNFNFPKMRWLWTMVRKSRIIACSLVLILLILGSSPLNMLFKESGPFNIIGGVNAFDGGDGTVSDPFHISNLIQLQNIKMNLSAHYKIIYDIDASDTNNWNEGKGFDPIGEKGNYFKGSLDGGNHEIRSLYINRRDQQRVGLIGFANQAIISNVVMVDVNVRGRSHVGGLVGSNFDTYLVNCFSSGEVESLEHTTGGLVGWNNGIIDNCSSTGNMTGEGIRIGGLVGENYFIGSISNCSSSTILRSSADFCGGIAGVNGGDIFNCHTTGDVYGNNYTGGLIGSQFAGNISNCIASGNVNGIDYAGGLVGWQFSGNISNCHASGNIDGMDYVAGLVGLTQGSVFNCYSVGNTTGNICVGGLTGCIYEGNVSNSYARGDVHCQI